MRQASQPAGITAAGAARPTYVRTHVASLTPFFRSCLLSTTSERASERANLPTNPSTLPFALLFLRYRSFLKSSLPSEKFASLVRMNLPFPSSKPREKKSKHLSGAASVCKSAGGTSRRRDVGIVLYFVFALRELPFPIFSGRLPAQLCFCSGILCTRMHLI